MSKVKILKNNQVINASRIQKSSAGVTSMDELLTNNGLKCTFQEKTFSNGATTKN